MADKFDSPATVEAVAKALLKVNYENESTTWEMLEDVTQEAYLRDAQAAITAMLEQMKMNEDEADKLAFAAACARYPGEPKDIPMEELNCRIGCRGGYKIALRALGLIAPPTTGEQKT